MTAPLTILNVAYALAPVGPDAVGGAEQVLSALDRALTAAGHRSLVVACRGSLAAGTLVDTGIDPDMPADEQARAAAQTATRDAVQRIVTRTQIDVVHAHGLDFAQTLPSCLPPTLVTLHLPPAWYGAFPPRSDFWMHCVSDAQHAACAPNAALLPPIPNGVDVNSLGRSRHAPRSYAMMLGRVCPEKGQHLALQAAHLAGRSLLIGGTVFPYPEHQAYFDEQVAPLLDAKRRFLGPLGFARKRRLLSAAACLLVPSLAPETSSLVAMEALACGTPVIAYPAGALAGLVHHGQTGFLVTNPAEMAAAIAEAAMLDRAECRRVAREKFSHGTMLAAYFKRYHDLRAGRVQHAA